MPSNKCRLRAPIILFLGAGATAPLGKMMMKEFVQHLRNQPRIAQSGLFHDIVMKNADLEFLLEQLQDWEQKAYLNYRVMGDNDYGPPQPPSIPIPQKMESNFHELAETAGSLRRLIQAEIFNHYRFFDSIAERKLKSYFEPLFQVVSQHLKTSEPIVVFTTNYDPAIEEFCRLNFAKYSLFDGFQFDPAHRQEIWRAELFTHWRPPKDSQRGVVLMKLHGSTSWAERLSRIIKTVGIKATDDPQVSNLMIYPTERKIATDDPFFTGYHYFQELASSAKCLLSVGYSFRDLDAFTRLKSALRVNPRLLIVHVSPNADHIEGALPLDVGNRSWPITGKYSPGAPDFNKTLAEIENSLREAFT